MALTLSPELTFLIGVAVFWVVLYVLAYVFHLEKRGLEVKPAYFMYKSKALNSFIDGLANKGRKLWTVLSNIGVALSIGLMVFSIYYLFSNLLRLVFQPRLAVPVVPAIPVLTISLYWLPYFFLAVGVVILTHELAHGIIARLQNIPVLSTGILAFLVFFGAFVEPDEKEFEKASLTTRLKMLAAGSSTNLVTGLLMFLLLLGLFAPPTGVLVQEVLPNSPFAKAGFGQWDVIYAVNGQRVIVPANLTNVMRNVKPNTTLLLTVLHNNELINKSVTTMASPSNSSQGIIGVLVGGSYSPSVFRLTQYANIDLFFALYWIFLLSISVAVFNMFPAFPFDGERMLYYPLASLVKKRKQELRQTLNILSWGLFAVNVILSLWQMGLRVI
jgi:membrane-associated protease RseP (regulator of RpoE activity)